MLNIFSQSTLNIDSKIVALIRSFDRDMPVVFLDTQDGGMGLLAVGSRSKLEVFGDSCSFTQKNKPPVILEMCPWKAIKKFREHKNWCFGYLSYDLKNHTEKLTSSNPDAIGAPDVLMVEPKYLFEINRASGEIKQLIGEPVKISETEIDIQKIALQFDDFKSQYAPYIQAIVQAKREIFEGDYYEINLSRQIQGGFTGDPLDLYMGMKSYGPVPFGAYIKNENMAVCCASPERFLKKTGNIIQSEPIKGTAPVSDDENENREMLETLQSSEKNKAENLMIVDLVRNDFSRISIPGSVEVEELFRIYRFKTLFQMISKVKGEVLPEACPVEIIKACFPMGSMTGAPKISAMKAIERLEKYKRGIYSGAIGYIKPNGDFDFNVVIRTAICKENKWYYSTGGAITADSDPDEEWQETIVKTRALTGFGRGE